MNSKSRTTETIRLFRTPPHPCSYKPGLEASTVFVDPELEITRGTHSRLGDIGFRRSGAHLYRPDCEGCSACISCRIPVSKFSPGRRFRRISNRNRDLEIRKTTTIEPASCYPLYERYINSRHQDGDMYPATPDQFDAFIVSATDHSVFYHFYADDRLIAVTLCDELDQGLSAVYTFFEPDQGFRSLGSFAILSLLEDARQNGLEYVYLGYWIKDCEKMDYKIHYRPIELLINGEWVLLT